MNNAVYDFETGYAGLPITQPGTGDNITARGDVALNNTTLNVSVNTLGVNAGYYRILSYTGNLSGNGLTLGSVTGDSVPAANIQTLTGDKHINLILGPSTTNLWNGNGAASATRAGGGDGTWTASSGNWNSPGNATGALPDGGYAIFTGAAGTVTVDGGAGPVRVSGIQFASDRYRLQGAPITLVGNGGNQPVIVVGDGTYASAQYVNTIANPLQGTQGFVKTGGLGDPDRRQQRPVRSHPDRRRRAGNRRQAQRPPSTSAAKSCWPASASWAPPLYPPPSSRRATTVRPSARSRSTAT